MKKSALPLFITVIFLFLFPGMVYTLEESVRIGREDSWNMINHGDSSNIILKEGRHGYPDIVLREGEYHPDEYTDMLFHFNTDSFSDAVGNYTVQSRSMTTQKMKKYGAGSAVFQRNSIIYLSPNPGALFSPGKTWSDFSMEFWLYPANLEEGETVFFWQGSDQRGDDLVTQQVICTVRDRRLQWDFINFFIPPDRSEYTVTIRGKSQLVPRRWKHHLLRFDSDTGLLEYLVDTNPEGVVYASKTGREDGTAYLPETGLFSSDPIQIGASFTGFMDELRISESFISEPFTARYKKTGGAVITGLLDLQYNGSRLLSIKPVDSTPGNTAINYYYYVTDIMVPLSSSEDERWTIMEPNKPVPEPPKGRFLQIMAKLYTDGYGELSPVVSEIVYEFEPDFPPTTPDNIQARPGDGKVHLTWKAVADTDAAGYLVYYGDTPGRYWGDESSNGPSPIDVGNVTEVTINQLVNNKLYFFSIVAYDTASPPHHSDFSDEVSARPSTLTR